MAFRKTKKNNPHHVIDRTPAPSGRPSGRAASVVVHNYYEAGPSGVEWTERTVEVAEYDSARPAKQPRLHSPPPVDATGQSSHDQARIQDEHGQHPFAEVSQPHQHGSLTSLSHDISGDVSADLTDTVPASSKPRNLEEANIGETTSTSEAATAPRKKKVSGSSLYQVDATLNLPYRSRLETSWMKLDLIYHRFYIVYSRERPML